MTEQSSKQSRFDKNKFVHRIFIGANFLCFMFEEFFFKFKGF